jgi:hypothetical protein
MIETDNSLAEVATGEASPEAVLRLARWLRANPDGWVRLYHGTAAPVPGANQGLFPTSTRRRNSLQSRSGYVSFSIFPGHAKMFALLAFPRRSVTVYGVDLRVRELVPDLDQLRNQRAWAERCVKPTLAHGLAYGHGPQVKGAVSAARLFAVRTVLPSRGATIGYQPSVSVATASVVRATLDVRPKTDFGASA